MTDHDHTNSANLAIAACASIVNTHGTVARLCRSIIDGFSKNETASLQDLNEARESDAGQTPIGNKRADGTFKKAFDELRSRLTKTAKDMGYRLTLTKDKDTGEYVAASLTPIVESKTMAIPPPSIVAATPKTMIDLRDHMLAQCAEHGVGVSDLIIGILNATGSGTQAAIAHFLTVAPIAPLAADSTLPIVGLSQDAIESSVQGITPRKSRRNSK